MIGFINYIIYYVSLCITKWSSWFFIIHEWKKLLKFSVTTIAYTNLNSFFLISKTWPDSRAVKVMSLQISLYELILREHILKWAERFFPANLPQPATAGLRSKEFRYLTLDLWEKCVFWLQKMKNLREGLRFSQKYFERKIQYMKIEEFWNLNAAGPFS